MLLALGVSMLVDLSSRLPCLSSIATQPLQDNLSIAPQELSEKGSGDKADLGSGRDTRKPTLDVAGDDDK
jgi:hypothetical protein